LCERDAEPLGHNIIHSVTNPIPRLTGAIHVYGGDFFKPGKRSEWDPETLLEGPWDPERAERRFEEANAIVARRSAPTGPSIGIPAQAGDPYSRPHRWACGYGSRLRGDDSGEICVQWRELHPKHTEARRRGRRRIEPGGERLAEHGAGVGRIDHAVIPQPRGRVMGAALPLILPADRRLELRVLLLPPLPALRCARLLADDREHARRLLAAHHRDAGVRPHPQEARPIGASAHAVIAGAIATANDDGVFRHRRGRDRGNELGAVLGDAAGLVLLADHKAGDLLQEQHRDPALAPPSHAHPAP